MLNILILENEWEDALVIKHRIEDEFRDSEISFSPVNKEQNNTLMQELDRYFGNIDGDDEFRRGFAESMKERTISSNLILLDYDFETKRDFTGVKIYDTFIKSNLDEYSIVVYFTNKGAKVIESINQSICSGFARDVSQKVVLVKKPFQKASDGTKKINEKILNSYPLLEIIRKLIEDKGTIDGVNPEPFLR